jgi:hypothetical protein
MPTEINTEQRPLCNAVLKLIRTYESKNVKSLIEIGVALIEVKNALPHGSYLSWLHEEVCYTARTAQHYMNVAQNLGDEYEVVSHLPLTIIYQIAALPEENRTDILAMITEPMKPPRDKIEQHLEALKAAAKQVEDDKRAATASREALTPEEQEKREKLQNKRREVERAAVENAHRQRVEDARACIERLDEFERSVMKDLLGRSGPQAFGEAFQTVFGVNDTNGPKSEEKDESVPTGAN